MSLWSNDMIVTKEYAFIFALLNSSCWYYLLW